MLAFIDPNGDPDRRLDGALLVAMAIDDLKELRGIFLKREGDE